MGLLLTVGGATGLLLSSGRAGYPGELVLTRCWTTARGSHECEGRFVAAPDVPDPGRFRGRTYRYVGTSPRDHPGARHRVRLGSPSSQSAWKLGTSAWAAELVPGAALLLAAIALLGYLLSRLL